MEIESDLLWQPPKDSDPPNNNSGRTLTLEIPLIPEGPPDEDLKRFLKSLNPALKDLLQIPEIKEITDRSKEYGRKLKKQIYFWRKDEPSTEFPSHPTPFEKLQRMIEFKINPKWDDIGQWMNDRGSVQELYPLFPFNIEITR